MEKQKLLENIIELKKNLKESEELIQSLKEENSNLKEENSNLKEKINELEEINKNNNLEYKNFYKTLIEKDDEIKKLRDELSKFPFKLFEGEKLMTIIISSFNESIQYAFICKNTDSFKNIEEKFYKIFPEYCETINIFTKNEKPINVNKSLDDNNIKDNDIILFKKI